MKPKMSERVGNGCCDAGSVQSPSQPLYVDICFITAAKRSQVHTFLQLRPLHARLLFLSLWASCFVGKNKLRLWFEKMNQTCNNEDLLSGHDCPAANITNKKVGQWRRCQTNTRNKSTNNSKVITRKEKQREKKHEHFSKTLNSLKNNTKNWFRCKKKSTMETTASYHRVFMNC